MAILAKLRACYPGGLSDPDVWKATLARYYEALGKYSPDVLAAAADKAWRESPKFFPTLGQLAEIAEAEEKARRPRAKLLDEPQGDHEQGKQRIREIINSLSGKMGLT